MVTRKVSIADIGERAGLSITTVSRVLNGKAEQYRIGKKSQQKIKEAAEELEYIPNYFASNLKSGKSRTIAIIVPSLTNPFFAGFASEINSEVRRFGYISIIGDSDENNETEKLELQQMVSRNIEGLIIAPCGNQFEHLKKLYEQGLPIVCIDRYFEHLDIPYVSTDNYDGAVTATKHLIENGHSLITCIQGIQQSTPNLLRIKGFKDAMEDAGIKSYNVVGDDFTIQNGYLETKLLLQQKEIPTAIFTLSNTIAMGCIKALKENNIRIPQDVSVITYDDHQYLDFLETPITCIAQPVSDISKIAIKFLFSRLSNDENRTKQVLLKPEIKIKKSVRKIN
jgi:LacI family transcriptional regulator